jgi:hypothetical protein
MTGSRVTSVELSALDCCPPLLLVSPFTSAHSDAAAFHER